MNNDWDTFLGWSFVIILIIVIVYFAYVLLMIVPTWRILRRAGFSGALSLLHLLPFFGTFIVFGILAFATWPAGEAQSRRSAAP